MKVVASKLKPEDVPSLRFEIQTLFTPSTPIKLADLFAGRRGQIRQMVEAIAEPGRHAILYGERGVGKTSLSQIVEHLVPSGRQRVVHSRKACAPGDTYETIWRKFFRDMWIEVGGDPTIDPYPGTIGPDDVLRELRRYSPNDIPIFVIDEFNEVDDNGHTSSLMANTIKALSDDGVNATLLIVGVADSVTDLFNEHGSIGRCTEEILMPRMSREELAEIIDKRLYQLGMTIEPDAKWKIVILARGLPTYIHRLGKHSATRAVDELRRHITEEDVDASLQDILAGSLQSLRDAYEAATSSNQPGNLFKEILLACALARSDDAGYFVPAAVREPLEKILGKPMTIAQYQNHLGDWHTEKRGRIIQRTGENRAYRFRFSDPAMQPYVLMKGIAGGLVSEDAKDILRFPQQRELFDANLVDG
ncbi:AAA family ATPase [Brevundimonas sp. SL130]|uniref:nSTAND1 domain-containing NTPase n=1 Tax=Brevundimonas sp. SL130 TaxID=2995143 RepID=UPI00226CD654|nr:AAA family ATPase [Brevundimonas sp. SL130]WAC59952.1 AAA family ATPase [Brevundimonas sp. SL130]